MRAARAASSAPAARRRRASPAHPSRSLGPASISPAGAPSATAWSAPARFASPVGLAVPAGGPPSLTSGRARRPEAPRPRPDPGVGGVDAGAGPAYLSRPRPPRRAARLPPLLGRRAPRRRPRRRALAGGPDRTDRRRDRTHAGWQRRRPG